MRRTGTPWLLTTLSPSPCVSKASTKLPSSPTIKRRLWPGSASRLSNTSLNALAAAFGNRETRRGLSGRIQPRSSPSNDFQSASASPQTLKFPVQTAHLVGPFADVLPLFLDLLGQLLHSAFVSLRRPSACGLGWRSLAELPCGAGPPPSDDVQGRSGERPRPSSWLLRPDDWRCPPAARASSAFFAAVMLKRSFRSCSISVFRRVARARLSASWAEASLVRVSSWAWSHGMTRPGLRFHGGVFLGRGPLVVEPGPEMLRACSRGLKEDELLAIACLARIECLACQRPRKASVD